MIMIVNEGLYVYDLYTDVIVIRFFLVRSDGCQVTCSFFINHAILYIVNCKVCSVNY